MSKPAGAQSPSLDQKQDPMGQAAPGKDAASSLTDAEQRPGVSGNSGKDQGQSGGSVGSAAVSSAQKAADSLAEAGKKP